MVTAGSLIRASDNAGDYLNAYLAADVNVSTTVTAFNFTLQSTPGNIDLASGSHGFEAPLDGLYLISWIFRCDRDATVDVVTQWRLNASGSSSGGSQVQASYCAPAGGTAGNISSSGSFAEVLDAGDTLEMFHNCAASSATAFFVGTSAGPVVSRLTVVRLPGPAS